MKKSIFSILTFFMLFALSGCGGGSDAPITGDDGTTATIVKTAAVEMKENYIVVNQDKITFTLPLSMTKKLDSSFLVELKNLDLDVMGCQLKSVSFNPSQLAMTGDYNTVSTINISGEFTAPCTVGGYTFKAIQVVSKGGNVETTDFGSTFDYHNPSGGGTVPGSEFSLTNLSTPLVVHEAESVHIISVDVVDANGIGVSGKSVSITAVKGVQFGSIVSASITQSDSAGHALFSYKAPVDMTAVDKMQTTLSVSLLENNATVMSKTMTIEFDKSSSTIPGEVVPIVVTPTASYTLTENNKNLQWTIKVFEEGTSTPYTSGTVKVILPSKVVSGVDVGSFQEYNATVDSTGKAVFSYTGPQDLQALVNSGDNGAVFEFYHELNPTNKTTITTSYDTSGGGYTPASYTLTTISSDGKQTIGLQSQKQFTLYLKDDQGTLIDDADITNVSMTTQNALVGKLFDPATGTDVLNLTYAGADAKNSKGFTVVTYTSSGLLPVKIIVDFLDSNGVAKQLSILMNVVVLSGPPTAMSISYAGVEQNTTTAKYIEKFAVTVTDAYNNPINTNPFVSTGAMVEYAVDGSAATDTRTTSSPRLWHGQLDSHGNIAAPDANNKTTFDAGSDVFKYVDYSNDKLVVFGAGFVYEALGKWDIFDTGSDSMLDLKDDYFGSDRTGLFYAIGHNNRQDLCRTDGTEYVGNMISPSYQIDATGHALIEFSYDYHLTGKDIMVWVNLTGYQADTDTTIRIGEAKKHTLRGNGLVTPDAYSLKPGVTGYYRFNIHHENAPEWYRNGHFGYAVVGSCTVLPSDPGEDKGNYDYDARDCNLVTSYVRLKVTNNTTEDCTITLDGIAVSNEFDGVTYP